MIQPGTYTAKIKDYGIFQKEGGNPAAIVEFVISEFDTEQKITWFGYFHGGSREITVRTLIETFEFTGKTGEELAGGIGSNVINETRDYELVIEHDTYNGKIKPKIKYVNIPGRSRQISKVDKQNAKVVMAGLNLGGDFTALRATLPKPKKEDEDVLF